LARIDAERGTALFGDVANLDLRVRCPPWPVADLTDAFRAPVRTDVPVLLVSGTLDARTPPSNAADVLPGLSRGHHLVIDGGSHDDDLFLSSSRIGDAILRFLSTGDPGLTSISLPGLRVPGW
jgi:pimeloyl-ACP methyl ester carboxylesterase